MASVPTNPHLILTIAGTKKSGDSTEVGNGDIELYAVSWGASNPVDTQTGAQMTHTSWSDVSLTKRIDKVSPEIVKAMCTNQEVKIEIQVYKPPVSGDSKDTMVYKIVAEAARISSYSVGHGAGGGFPVESFTVSFRKITYTVGQVVHTDDWSKKG
jgi:type VI secretion system secreted protein Hcp